MDVSQLRLGRITFPGVAGQLQRQGATASLIRELGDNYSVYHAFLAERLARLGRPDPAAYRSYEAYANACAAVEEVVHAEIALRACQGFRHFGRPLDATVEAPLIDDKDRLLADPRQRSVS